MIPHCNNLPQEVIQIGSCQGVVGRGRRAGSLGRFVTRVLPASFVAWGSGTVEFPTDQRPLQGSVTETLHYVSRPSESRKVEWGLVVSNWSNRRTADKCVSADLATHADVARSRPASSSFTAFGLNKASSLQR